MRMLLKSLSRNESSTASYDRIVKDIEIYENEEELIESRQTVSDYIIVNQESYDINYRTSKRIGKSAKRDLVDSSLACTLLKFYNYVEKKTKFMCIIVGYYEAIVYDKESNIYILPITSLKP